MEKDSIESVIRSLREAVLHGVSLHSKRRDEVRADTGKRGSASTFVHFRQLFQEGGVRLASLDITGIDEHRALASGEAGRGATSSVVPLFMPQNEERRDFRESRNVHFRQLVRERCVHQWGLTRLP